MSQVSIGILEMRRDEANIRVASLLPVPGSRITDNPKMMQRFREQWLTELAMQAEFLKARFLSAAERYAQFSTTDEDQRRKIVEHAEATFEEFVLAQAERLRQGDVAEKV